MGGPVLALQGECSAPIRRESMKKLSLIAMLALFDPCLVPGQAEPCDRNSYPDADNGNHSALHWDLVCIQSPEYGGGEIWFDGKLFRKDGLFVLPELLGLNPENLK
jgi:hypothetical protein